MTTPDGVRAADAGGRGALWRRWVLATMVGEFLGFAVPAAVGPLAVQSVGLLPEVGRTLVTLLLVALAGVVEGATLGLAQSLVLRRDIRGFASGDWVRATALGAGLAYLLGMTPNALLDLFPLGMPVFVALWVVLGIPLLLTIGGAQALILRRYVSGAGRWVTANALAWLVGLAAPFVGLALVPDGSPVIAFVVAGLLSGLLMGAVVGAVTGFALIRLLLADS